ncbi:hypothetical protein [Carboxylicivirga marina]|uniref:hypothetical protein n=1 Tax=Carboxylicivirga marina TaxID=2800988 RepID=UPI002592E376|nr:hypothetical protein [uncultured Carboxylicivirga sp.]
MLKAYIKTKGNQKLESFEAETEKELINKLQRAGHHVWIIQNSNEPEPDIKETWTTIKYNLSSNKTAGFKGIYYKQQEAEAAKTDMEKQRPNEVWRISTTVNRK